MEKELLVKVENVSKKFTTKLKDSLKYGFIDILKSTFGFEISSELRKNEFWAVQNISFELRRGECIGLIGHNGAGKSSLLKVLNGLYAPDKGKITMKGKVGALIELGAGFNPILSGRENIYNNAAILGFTKEEVNEKMQSIIDFAEIDDFLDMPVQNYSSGMRVRLGFAVAAHLEPDILIVDEVLAVGDLGFVLKCFKKIDEILPNTAVIFVSHSMPMISRICNQIILMDHGKVEYQGTDISRGIELYYNKFSNNESNVVLDDKSIEILSCKTDLENQTLDRHEDFTIDLEIKILNPKIKEVPNVYFEIKDKDLRPIAGFSAIGKEAFNQSKIHYKVKVKNSLLTLGNYVIDVGISDYTNNEPYYRANNLISFISKGERQKWVPFELETETQILEIH
ncbi:ABC transporter ATP-binding protein [Elizabethkingia sp. JS20170427COW]|uniref:ABC transporter ATP-binding protein n=1 Tax=Elizabethkingia sp. JS20170427COW TaxID=2583851 RepID=UPI00111031C2|nr:ABC transporter ATP-binding protein [Elizabethkingia sp. JS20170427COW]QCX53439.1 ATP-binding cassette domain-containing protein [Elizabethkingia sp. JS20170427COW]